MSIRMMSAVWELALPAFEKLVLLALADCANDEGECWPSIATLKRKTGAGERTIQRAIRALELEGVVERKETIGKGNRYWLHPRHTGTPARAAPVSDRHPPPPERHPTPARAAPKPSITVKEPSNHCASDDALRPEHVFEKWNETAVRIGRPQVRDLTPERRSKLKARIAGYSLDDFRTVLANIEASPFLRGEKNWSGVTFDWFTKKANFQKILEGNYNG
jgi:hypothetical protein